MVIQVVVLAAGQGKRMHSKLPKVLHRLGGKPILEHIITTALKLTPKATPIIVCGHQAEVLKQALSHFDLRFATQKEQLGTGHAVLQALPHIKEEDQVLILCGDVPLISEETLKKLITTTPPHAIGMLTAELREPAGYGRIKRNNKHEIIGIIEEKDATDAERAIHEINTGIYFLPAELLKKWLPMLSNQNAQKEYYLTDIIAHAVKENIALHATQPEKPEEIFGVNDRAQLIHLERFYQKQYALNLLRKGITIADPARFDVRGELHVGRDVSMDVNVIIEGRVVIGDDCEIGPNVILRNTHLGKRVHVKANSILDGAEIADDCVIGPFARLRPGTELSEGAHIGNFVEVKNSKMGAGSKANHLTYLGDSEIGKRVNIGAGTITCNYDGVNKHKTIIGDNAFIGSNTELVAPVTIGEGATIGAGSTITKDTPPNQLTLARSQQRTIDDWQRPQKSKLVNTDENQ